MTNKMQIFQNQEFGQVRTIEEKGKVLFCGSDVASALGYVNSRDAISRHCKGVVKHDGVSFSTNQYGVESQQIVKMSYIPEPDLYRLIMKSKLPSAEKFESWVFDEVLPSIRKNGMYVTDNLLENPELLANTTQLLLDNKALRNYNETLISDVSFIKSQLAKIVPMTKYSNWKTSVNQRIKELTENSGKTHNQYLREIYQKFASNGYDLNKLKEHYLNETGIVGCSTINFIDSQDHLRLKFDSYLLVPSLLAEQEQRIVSINPIKAAMQPLMEKYNDKSKGGTATYRKIYAVMGINWKYRQTRYKNINHLKNPPKKTTLIEQDEKLLKLFLVSVGKLLSE